MFALNLPEAEINIRDNEGKTEIFDFLRSRYVALSPEEVVRQQFVHWLVEHKGYPAARMGNEIELEANGKKRRCDSVVFDSLGMPLMIIEYKAPTVAITQKVFEQISSYNVILHARYIIASNGLNHYCARVDYDTKSYCFLRDIPDYSELEPDTINSEP